MIFTIPVLPTQTENVAPPMSKIVTSQMLRYTINVRDFKVEEPSVSNSVTCLLTKRTFGVNSQKNLSLISYTIPGSAVRSL